MTRTRTKKLNEGLNRLTEHISNSCLVHDTNLLKICIQDNLKIIEVSGTCVLHVFFCS